MFVVETSPAGGPPGAGAVVAGTPGMVVVAVTERVRSAVLPRSGWDSRVIYVVEAALAEDWFCAEDSAEIEIELQGGDDEDS